MLTPTTTATTPAPRHTHAPSRTMQEGPLATQPPSNPNSTATITITTYNVISARGTKLLEALRAMHDINTDIAILTEAKLVDDKHTHQGHGYTVFATSAPSTQQGGVALAWRQSPHWLLEGMRAISPNSVSATLVSGDHRWLLLGTYLSPNESPKAELNALELEHHRNLRLPVIIVGDFNTDLDNDSDERSIAIATTMQHLGVIDSLHRFPQKQHRRNTRHRRLRDGSRQRSRCDYAMADPCIAIKSLRIVDPPRFHSDHWAMKLQVQSDNINRHRRYLSNRSQLPAIAAAPDEQIPNEMFTQLLTFHERRNGPSYPPRDSWIALDTWTLIDQRNSALRRSAPPEELRPLRKAIRKKVRRDRAARLQETGDQIQAHLDADDPKEAWRLVKVWYRRNARAVPPTPIDLRGIEQDFRALYAQQTPPGEPIRGRVHYQIPDTIPQPHEIGEALRSLRNGRAPGPSGMTVEDLKRWCANQEAEPAPWRLVIRLVQHAFQTGAVPTRARSNTLVLIPKPEAGQVRGIGLLEPVWKLISAIINQRLMRHITFHDDLHGFLPGRGTGTACLEAKLEAQWAFRSGHPLYHIFIDFTKAYDSLDRSRTLLLLADYGVGPNTIQLLAMFWERHVVIPRQHQFYGEPFPADRGLTTGDIPAPVIYNIVTDAVL